MCNWYRKRPVAVQALRWVGMNFQEVQQLCPDATYQGKYGTLNIPTLEGTMAAQLGDWIIKGVKGECYPCKPDIFEMTYETISEGDKPC